MNTLIKLLVIGAMLASLDLAMSETVIKYCNPEKSKPCGQACIPKASLCRKSWTTNKVGIRPKSEKGQSFETPKFVSEVPK
jgi:hypothetical protein